MAWRRNEGGMIPSDTLLPLLQVLYHAAAPAGGAFTLRGALNLVTPSALSRLKVSWLDFANLPQQAQSPSEPPSYSFVHRVSFASPKGSFRSGATERPLRKTNSSQTCLFYLKSLSDRAILCLLLLSTASLSPPR